MHKSVGADIFHEPDMVLEPHHSQQQHTQMKRKLEEYTAGPLDEQTGQRCAFPVDSVAAQDLEGPPMDVAHYLAQVKREADQSPAFRTASGHKSRGPSAYAHQHSSAEVKPLSVVNEWRVQIRKSFMDVRKSARTHDSKPEIPAGFELPPTFSRWKVLIASPTAPEPSLGLIASLSHQQSFVLIEYCHKWLGPKVTRGLSLWIMGLLACLPDLLDASEQASVRNMGKRALEILQNPRYTTLNDVTLFTLKSLVVICADVFHQSDLIKTVIVTERERPVQVDEVVLDY